MLQYKKHNIGWWPVVVSLFLIFILAGCGSEETPEDQVKQVLAQLQDLSEQIESAYARWEALSAETS